MRLTLVPDRGGAIRRRTTRRRLTRRGVRDAALAAGHEMR